MINQDDVDRMYDMLKTWAHGKSFTHTQLIEFSTNLFNMLYPNTNISKNLIDNIVEKYESNMSIQAFTPDVLIDFDNDPEWFHKMKADENTKHDYFKRYKAYLRHNDFAEQSIDNIEHNSETILSYCANPFNPKDIKARKKKGLVVGDVQSGKTANYLGLINMASDYGYSVILVLAGMTESLRKQTQDRIDEGYIGAISSTIGKENIHYIGVSELDTRKDHYAIPLTNNTNDFSTKVKDSINAIRGDYKKPQILVVKKNKRTLENVKEWIKPDQSIVDGDSILIIDDEADNASINTSKSNENPSVINKLIREIFNNFKIASYVGYTATPYANIFIDPNDENNNYDLFPSDFIVQLNPPENYFGGYKVFERLPNDKFRHIRVIEENEQYFLPVHHKREDPYFGLSDSLKEAIQSFVLNNVLRTLKGGNHYKKHRTMMINISRFNDKQADIQYYVEQYITKLKNIINQTAYMSTDNFIRNEEMNNLYKLYHTDDFYLNMKVRYDWSKIQELLCDEVNKIVVVTINNKNKNRFSYADYENGARLIAIGGFVLSRGLTLEGLMISYFSRSGSAYDTLLQMCRWFGYRPGYEHLCRIYMSRISIMNFLTVLEATEDLKGQFREMRAIGKTPKNFGLMVKESPDVLETSLLVTSRNKTGRSEEIIRTLNYSAKPVDTSKLYKDKDLNDKNKNAVKTFIEDLKSLYGITLVQENGRYVFKRVHKSSIAKLLRTLCIPLENRKFDTESLVDFIQNTEEFQEWDVAIATGNKTNLNFNIANYSIPATKRSFDVRSEENYIRISGSNNRLVEPGIFNTGLTDDQIKELKKRNKTPTAKDYLGVEGRRPLFVIYPVQLYQNEKDKTGVKDEEKERLLTIYSNEIIFGFGIGFPSHGDDVKIKFRANQIKIRELLKAYEEDEDDDDFDY